MTDIRKLLDELQQRRDELKIQIHLGSMEAKQEWDTLEEKWAKLASVAAEEAEHGAEKIAAAATSLGSQLKDGYERIKKALD